MNKYISALGLATLIMWLAIVGTLTFDKNENIDATNHYIEKTYFKIVNSSDIQSSAEIFVSEDKETVHIGVDENKCKAAECWDNLDVCYVCKMNGGSNE